MTIHPEGTQPLLTPSEVAVLFRVDPKAVSRWASTGKLPAIRTLGGHRTFPADEVYALLNESQHSGGGTPTD